MTHVSKRKLKDGQFNQLYKELHHIIAKLDATRSRGFFDELLGEEEKIMLVKRLSAIVMFHQGHSVYRVSQALIISPSTAERLKLKYDIGSYSTIVGQLQKNREEYTSFLRILEIVLQAGLPPRTKDRWKHVFKNT